MNLLDLKTIVNRDREITHKAVRRKKKTKLQPNLDEIGIRGTKPHRFKEPPNGAADGTDTGGYPV